MNGYLIEISEDKVDRVAEHIEKALRHAGMAMQCVEEMYDNGYGYGERERDDDPSDWRGDERMGERGYGRGRYMGERRRRRRADGRYM